MIKNLWYYFDKLPFSFKTSILIFIIAGGMISIIILSQISIHTLKNDFDILFEKRTQPIIKLEKIKDIYKINIYDTLYDIQQKNITVEQAQEIIYLAQEIINKNWKNYLNTTQNNKLVKSYVSRKINEFFSINQNTHNNLIKSSTINNIDNKINNLHKKILKVLQLLKIRKDKGISTLIHEIYFEINSINIYITNLSNYDLNLAISERRETLKTFSTLTTILNISIIFVFLFSIILSIILINNFRKLHFVLKNSISEKTKELQELNDYLEFKISKEVANSRKKDLIMFQQAKLASLGEMLGNIAHQWRQPLGSLMMIIQGFQTKMHLGKLSFEYVEQKTEDAILLAQNMSNTLDDFQNFFRPNKDKSYFNIKDCVNHSIELSKYIIEQENINLEFIVEEDLEIYGFYNELSHVILNIISNAKDALKEIHKEKHIKINLKKHKEKARIIICDNAGGVKKEILPHIFDPYYTTKYKSAGTGIGLYMSKQIIERHMQGNIKCKNILDDTVTNNLENGAQFIIDLPINEEGKN